ncbi:hypothetical protein FGG08_000856 [Glutinoglossum americanum]|uniref:Vacuolar protein sorting/targeting protein 10 n=1 Tax=Glutinoglossum americanum TaxID=1670608 RepID=A0A9P8L5S8_9PEZI|nr:hypothetical protein FGG08_000856 [Glutinoglossum americanum]
MEIMEGSTGRRRGPWQASAWLSKNYHHRPQFSLSLLQQLCLLLVLLSSFGGIVGADDEPDEVDSLINSKTTTFDARRFLGFYYLERSDRDDTDETIIMQDEMRTVWITHDHGKTWKEPSALKDVEIIEIYPHPYKKDRIFFVTGSTTVYYSLDRGKTIRSFEAIKRPNEKWLRTMDFHPNQPDWIIWTAAEDCGMGSLNCHSEAWITQNRGKSWEFLRGYVRKCQFIAEEGRGDSEKLIYCEQFEREDIAPNNPLRLIASDDFFIESRTTHFEDIIDFATMSEFIIVAAKDNDQKSLKVDASVDGRHFADAKFPPDFQVPHQQAYTVLDSSTHSVFLHVTVNNRRGYEFGTIIKSNSNGTSYILSHRAVNRNIDGYVDFEKMQGLEGVAIINIVANPDESFLGQQKILKTKMTHNDGAEWDYLEAPANGADGKPVGCDTKNKETCSLHLHGYTERKDVRDTFSSPSAVGLMMGVGNVGDHLTEMFGGNTYITRDGGISWHEVKNGTYMWEYGDQGSIIVIVEESTPTNQVYYTLDEGATWKPYQFAEEMMTVDEITTVPSDNARQFLLWGREAISRKIATVNLDFTSLTDRRCKIKGEDSEGDYYLWESKHPQQDGKDNCLFGHITQYHRKKVDVSCYNGLQLLSPEIKKNCSCSRKDFECNYNFERQNDGSCAQVGDPGDPKQICIDDPNADEWHELTPYRRIPITTCHGGYEPDIEATPHECPGHGEEFRKKHRISGVGLFFAVTIPFAIAAAIGWWAYFNWDGKFGRIRLGDSAQATFSSDSPFIAYPVAFISAIVAVLATVPLLVSSLWRSVASRFGGGSSVRYTTRSSFSRGRGDYAVVAENYSEDGELLGDDSDEEPAGGTV